MTDIVISIAAKVAEYLVAPIGRELGHLFCYRSHMDELNKKIQEMGSVRGDLQITVDAAIRSGDEIRPIVQNWLNRADGITKEAEELMKGENKSCFNGWCPNLKSRYLLSRKAYKKAQVIVQIQKEGNFPQGVSYRGPLRSCTFKNYEPFGSRASILKELMDALRDDKIKMIGVWGMGGVGKTTLVKQVAEQAKQGKLFTTEVYIDASWTRDPEKLQQGTAKIQQKIVDMLGLKFKGKDESTRAVELKQILKKEKILIILDDIWKELDLEEVGIPCKDDQTACKVVWTSRDLHLLRQYVDAKNCFRIQQLPPEEAWSLFNKTAGCSLEKDLELRPIAMKVLEKCEGLPIAIVTIAKALKGGSVAVWKKALEELRRSAPTNIREVSENVYSCLAFSYIHLESVEVKSLFLLCGLLGDGDISLDDLLKYGMDLDLFDDIDSLEQARNKLLTLVEILKDSSLLLEVEGGRYREAPSLFFVEEGNGFVRMHDVVRDVAKAIASKDPHRSVVKEALGLRGWQKRVHELGNCTRVCLNCSDIHELPEGLVCPKLEFFLLNSKDNYLKIPDTFFKEMKEVRVLSLFRIDLTQLPSSLHFLSNLRTLCLHGCGMLKDIAILGGLKKLQILSLVDCKILEFPKEMMQLTDLRMLQLRLRDSSILVPRNVISSLSRLEHVCMRDCFDEGKSEGVDDGGRNAWLSELKHLSCLRALEVNIPHSYLLPEDVSFENLTRYDILLGCRSRIYYNDKALRRLTLERVKGPHLVKCFSKLLKTVEALQLSNLDDTKHVYELGSDDFLQLKFLSIYSCDAMQYIVNTMEMKWTDPPHSAFPLLEELCFDCLPNMEAVCQGPIPMGCFANLRVLIISNCSSLKYILWLPTAPGRESVVLEFPQLRSLKLINLPDLIGFYSTGASGIQEQCIPFFNEQVALPRLESLQLFLLENVRTVWDNQHPAGSFSKLVDLHVTHCKNLLTVFPSNILEGFQSLQILKITNCCSLEEIFEVGERNTIEISGVGVPALKEMSSHDQNVKSVRKKDPQGYFAFQNLNSLSVSSCTSLKYLFPASVVNGLVQLEVLEISYCGVEEIVAHENGVEPVPMFLFPRLSSLILKCLGQLKSFYREKYTLRCPRLKKLEICDCDKVDILFQGKSLQGELDKQPLFLVEKNTFPNVEELKLSLKVTVIRLELLHLDSMENFRTVWDRQDPVGSFSKLKNLHLIGCQNLLTVFLSNCLEGLQSLRTLEIKDCGPLNEIFEVGEINRAESDGIAVPPLKEMSSHDQNMKSVRKKDPQRYLTFQNLNSLSVSKCSSLKYLFPASVVKGLVQLEVLEISDCGVEEIVANENGVETVPPLKAMSSHDQNMKSVRKKDPQGYLPFQNLNSLSVSKCSSLKYLFPASVVQGLVQLEVLEISECGVEEIVANENGVEAVPMFLFPRLTSLKLDDLGQLKRFYRGNYTLGCPLLKKLVACNCDKVELLLQEKSLQGEVDKQPLFLVEKNTFPNVEELELRFKGPMEIWWGKFSWELFGKLRVLEIGACHDISVVIPSSKLQVLHNLEQLIVRSCNSVKEIIQEEGLAGETIPRLTKIYLQGLPMLTHLSGLQPILQNLRYLQVFQCPNLINLVSPSMAKRLVQLKELSITECYMVKEIVGDDGSEATDDISFTKLQKLQLGNLVNLKSFSSASSTFKFQSLEDMEVRGLLRLTHLYKIIPGLDQNLQKLRILTVCACGNLEMFLTPSMAKALVQLEVLRVACCCEVKEIVENEGGEAKDDGIIFPKLQKLDLTSLPQLKSFCSARYTFRFPCLTEVQVIDCPELEFFCKGDLITQRLEKVQMSLFSSRWENDLNTAIKKKFMETHSKEKVPDEEDVEEGNSEEQHPKMILWKKTPRKRILKEEKMDP